MGVGWSVKKKVDKKGDTERSQKVMEIVLGRNEEIEEVAG